MAHALTQRQVTIDELHRHGIHGPEIYLLDAMPLIEMAWADGKIQPAERSMILAFVEHLLIKLQGEAGFAPVTTRQALEFVDRFTAEQPTLLQFKTWRDLLKKLRLVEGAGWATRARAIMEGVHSVGGVAESPVMPRVSWDEREVEAMWRIENSLLRDD